jgi:hypothetical protein
MWVLNLGNLKDPISNDLLPYSAGDTLFLAFEGGSAGAEADTVVLLPDGPQDCGVQALYPPPGAVDPDTPVPSRYFLSSGVPNPFTGRTVLSFDLPVACATQLRVYDVGGRLVRTLVDQTLPEGRHQVVWDVPGESSEGVPPGVYFARLQAGGFRATERLVVLR